MKKKNKDYPHTVDEAVSLIIMDLSLRERVEIARVQEKDLVELNHSIGLYIREKFGLWFENLELINSCNAEVPADGREEYLRTPSFIIIKELWRRLRQDHGLRLVK